MKKTIKFSSTVKHKFACFHSSYPYYLRSDVQCGSQPCFNHYSILLTVPDFLSTLTKIMRCQLVYGTNFQVLPSLLLSAHCSWLTKSIMTRIRYNYPSITWCDIKLHLKFIVVSCFRERVLIHSLQLRTSSA